MRFIALLRKELREALPWILLATAVMLAFGGLDVMGTMHYADMMWRMNLHQDGYINSFEWLTCSDLRNEGPLLLLTSCGLGILLAGRQFLLPTLSGEWPFTLHRSISRGAVLAAKLCAAGTAFALGIGLVWTLLFLWASRPGAMRHPVEGKIYWEGWLYILLGVMGYLAAAVTSMSRARWFTTRLFPLALAAIILCLVVVEWSMPVMAGLLVIGLALPAAQLVDLALRREF